ncbi:MAG TPA: ABC transporter substrate-binding protein [Syntrophorhabdaceae bacterium]|nr:ABC transporter substrate-binding protein [Syntrophorhabdaceae bacterium]
MKSFRGFGIFKMVLSVIAVFTLLTGSGEAAQNDKVSPAKQDVKESIRRGGVLKIISVGGAISPGEPAEISSPHDSTFASPAIESLLALDNKGNPIPCLATGWTISKDAKTITMTLRKGVKFHDGTDFNAQAAKHDLDMFRASPKRVTLKSVSSVEIIDDYTIRLNLSQFESHILASLATAPGMMISPTAFKTHNKEWIMRNPVGTGPFKLVKHERDVSLVYERFQGYWQKGKPHLDGIEFKFVDDAYSALMAFKAGEGDLIMRIDAKDANTLQATGKYTIDKVPVSINGLVSDGSKAGSPFSDIRVRRAVEHAINKESIVKTLFYGISKSVNQSASPDNQNYNPAIKGYPYDPKKAKELLVSAGYPQGFKSKIIYRTTDTGYVFVAVQDYLKSVGIDVQLEVVSPTQYSKIINTGWDNALVYFYLPCGNGMDPASSLNTFFTTKSLLLKSAFRSNKFDAIVLKASAEPDPKKRTVLYKELGRMLTDEYAMAIPIYVNYSIAARTPQVHDTRLFNIWPTRWTPEDAWLSSSGPQKK